MTMRWDNWCWCFLEVLLLVLNTRVTPGLSEDGPEHSADHYYRWLTMEGARSIIRDIAANEANKQPNGRGKDRRTSEPLITGDGFRSMAAQICDETNRCRPDLDKLKRWVLITYLVSKNYLSPHSLMIDMRRGDCIFINQDSFQWFGKEAVERIKEPYILITHNGDLSTPDGQDDAELRLPKYNTTHVLQREYEKGRLLALHSENLWWKDPKRNPKPSYAHCIPIGLENRYLWRG